MTPELLRQKAKWAQKAADICSDGTLQEHADQLLAHAAALEEVERIKANRDFWMESCKAAQEHRDGANAQIALLEQEVERLNAAWKAQQFHLEAEERESAHWQERAEKAERRAERLKVHAEAMHDRYHEWNECAADNHEGALQALHDATDDYRAEFKEE